MEVQEPMDAYQCRMGENMGFSLGLNPLAPARVPQGANGFIPRFGMNLVVDFDVSHGHSGFWQRFCQDPLHPYECGIGALVWTGVQILAVCNC